MNRFIIAFLLIPLAGQAFAGESVTPEDMQAYEAQAKAARDAMNSPEYKQQMQHMMQQMKSQGIDTQGMQHGMKDMQKINGKSMKAAMDMNQCMQEKIGAEGMERLSTRGKELDARVRTLCAAGKRGAAETAQKEYAAEMMRSEEYKAMQTCADKYKEMMNDPAFIAMKSHMEGKNGGVKKHVCG